MQRIKKGKEDNVFLHRNNRMNKQKRFLTTLLMLALIAGTVAQQVGDNSPYGRYGYGTLSKPALGATEAMGGVSYGIRRGTHINPGNPASYSAADSLNFTIEMGVSGQYSRLSDDMNKQSFQNGNFDYLAFQFPLFKNIGMSVGLLPYSKVGYEFGRNQYDEDLSYRESFFGSGGLSKIYAGIGYSPIKYFSLGTNVSYLFGDIRHVRDIPRVGQSGEALNRLKSNEFSIKNVMFDIGAQFTYPINVNESLTLGVVYTPQVKNTTTIYPTDRLYPQNEDKPLPTDTLYNQQFNIPHKLGVGIGYKSINWLVGVDGSLQTWSKEKYPDYLDNMTLESRFNDKYSINIGAEYVADPVNRNFFKRMRIRGGLSYSNSYINTKVYDPKNEETLLGTGGYKEYGVNVGFGLPFRDIYTGTGKTSTLNLGFGYSLMNPDMKHMIKEEMFKIYLSLNINEFWFFKRQFD